MTKNRMFSIITIACFVSILFIPIGVVLMFFYTNWKKKLKIILASVLTALYVILGILFFNLTPSYNPNGINLPFSIGQQENQINSKGISKNKKEQILPQDDMNLHLELDEELPPEEPKSRLPKTVSKKREFFTSRPFYILMFFLFMLFLIIHQNIKSSKKKQGYENPYVDTDKYKLPLPNDFEFPMVHFQKIKIKKDEKILFATETTKKEEEGDFVVTNQRVVVLSKNGDYEFPLPALTAVSSVSNTVMLLTCGERKYYIFFPEGQIKYALAVIRWAYSN